jgi:hypothetical protein
MKDKAAQLKIIKEILRTRPSYITCDGCSRSYLPLAKSAQDFCPLCGHDHISLSASEDAELEGLDEYSQDIEISSHDFKIDTSGVFNGLIEDLRKTVG